MKKLLVISIIMLAVIGAGIYEGIFLRSYYTRIADMLDVAAGFVAEEKFGEAQNVVDELMDEWDEKKSLMLLFNNHNTVNNIYAQLSSASVYVSQEEKSDSITHLKAASALCKAAANDTVFYLYNIL